MRSDKLVQRMQTDPLFKNCKWATVVPKDGGGFEELDGCMALCDGGYHNWVETMSGMKQPTTPEQAQWSGRCSPHSLTMRIFAYASSPHSFSMRIFRRQLSQNEGDS